MKNSPLSSCCKAPVKRVDTSNNNFTARNVFICDSCNKACSIEEPKKVWLENLGIEVPIFKIDYEKNQVVVKVSDIPPKIARGAYLKSEYVRYWLEGGNRLVADHPPASTGHGVEGKVEKLQNMTSNSDIRYAFDEALAIIREEI